MKPLGARGVNRQSLKKQISYWKTQNITYWDQFVSPEDQNRSKDLNLVDDEIFRWSWLYNLFKIGVRSLHDVHEMNS
jgi:hypothetical protein